MVTKYYFEGRDSYRNGEPFYPPDWDDWTMFRQTEWEAGRHLGASQEANKLAFRVLETRS